MTPLEFIKLRLERAPKLGVSIVEVMRACDCSPDEIKAIFTELVEAGEARPVWYGNRKRIASINPEPRKPRYLTDFTYSPGSGINGFGYDPEKLLLEIEFTKDAVLYRYFKVPASVYLAFAESMAIKERRSASFRLLIRNRFPYERVRL